MKGTIFSRQWIIASATILWFGIQLCDTSWLKSHLSDIYSLTAAGRSNNHLSTLPICARAVYLLSITVLSRITFKYRSRRKSRLWAVILGLTWKMQIQSIHSSCWHTLSFLADLGSCWEEHRPRDNNKILTAQRVVLKALSFPHPQYSSMT